MSEPKELFLLQMSYTYRLVMSPATRALSFLFCLPTACAVGYFMVASFAGLVFSCPIFSDKEVSYAVFNSRRMLLPAAPGGDGYSLADSLSDFRIARIRKAPGDDKWVRPC